MSDKRTSAIVLGALIVAGALWAPWYAIELTPAARETIGAGTRQLPGVVGEFARQLLTVLPSRIEATAWQAFEKGDIVLLVCALAAIFAALLGRMDVVAVAGALAAGTAVLAIVSRPGPAELVSVRWGAWLALGGALLVVGASRMRAKAAVAQAPPPPDWTRPAAPLSPGAEPERSFAPF